MKIIFFSHPDFFNSRSMHIYLNMLKEGMESRGHEVQVWKPVAWLYKLPAPGPFKKWLGYIDQYIIFPFQFSRRIKNEKGSIFVFTDNALGPWVPYVGHLPHVVHCHDFLAQNSGKGSFTENKTGWTGRKYQEFIFRGYRKGKNFISVSNKTKEDLHSILGKIPELSEVVYNGLNNRFIPQDAHEARILLSKKIDLGLNGGFILHVGGNLWYKNRKGVVEIYDQWRKKSQLSLPLILVGEKSDEALSNLINASPFRHDILILGGVDDEYLHTLYSAASLFIFPSLEEGFGWPIAEAMACGCIVLTTETAPMNEVGGETAFYLQRRPNDKYAVHNWIQESADRVEIILNLSQEEKRQRVAKGLENVKQFDLELNLDKMEKIYNRILMAGSSNFMAEKMEGKQN